MTKKIGKVVLEFMAVVFFCVFLWWLAYSAYHEQEEFVSKVSAATEQRQPDTKMLDEQGKLKEQYRQPDTKTVADKFSKKPPNVKILSDWSSHTTGNMAYRYVDIDGRLATESECQVFLGNNCMIIQFWNFVPTAAYLENAR